VLIIPPSNPIVSISPILGLRGVRQALREAHAPIAAVSPLLGPKPIKGPLHRMMAGLGHEVSAVGVAKLYRGIVDLFAIDRADSHLAPRIAALGIQPLVTNIVMSTPARSRELARALFAALDCGS
jgi:LPPG:FO 2-phospho-L-lactate transferase